MPHVLIVAGPNGAGKTTFMRQWWPLNATNHVFVNADEIARSLASPVLQGAALDLAAGRKMLGELGRLTAERRNIVVETTLATLTYARRVREWKRSGYLVSLVYLQLPNVEASIARVARRVSLGGHDKPIFVAASSARSTIWKLSTSRSLTSGRSGPI